VKHVVLSTLMAVMAIPATANAQALTPEQKTEVEALVKSYLLDNGQDIMESVTRFQMKQEEEANKQSAVKAVQLQESLKTDKTVPVVGNPKGDVTVVEFFDYNCGYCKKAFEEIQTLLKDDKNVKVVLYDMPILGPSSLEASKWALAAQKQGKYWEFHKGMMLHQGAADEAAFKKIAEDAGLKIEKLMKDKDSEEVANLIMKHVEVARDLGVQGTPGFLVGNQVFKGYIPYDEMKNAIKKARSAGDKEETNPKKD
jgi:protein-disulfide isomerase